MTTAIGVFLGLVGPFGSFLNGPAWQRLAYWLTMAWLGYAMFGLAMPAVLRRLPKSPARWAVLAAYVALVCVPYSALSWGLAHAIWPRLAELSWLTPPLWYLECLTIAAPLVALFAWRRTVGRPAEPNVAPAAGLLQVRTSEVVCLQMEDHYVRVHTAGGSRLVLATMRQAVSALGDARGVRTHRSWWVAEQAVTGVLAEGRNLRLTLSNGVIAPVARTAVAALREAGWLQRPQASPASALAQAES